MPSSHESSSTQSLASEPVSATDGSADSQAADLEERTWKPRKSLAWIIRLVAFVSPILASVAAARTFAHLIPKPIGTLDTILWVVGLLAVALLFMRVTEVLARRLLPITAMLKMSLVFPDEAPSQFAIALRSASGKQLQAAVERQNAEQAMGTPQEAAENLVVLLSALRAHDPITRGHSERVRAYSDVIAQQMELSPEDAAKLHWGALIHDLGKLEVPPELLNKRDRLTADEWKIMKGHPEAAEKWISGLSEWLGPWALAATEHHERWDGEGYPKGLKGEEISLAGRIVAVADAFDVMTAARAYKDPLPHEQARAELAKGSGTQFDPQVVRAMLDASIPEMRWRVGPLATIANLPTVLSAPIAASVGAAGTAATTVGTAAVITAASLAPAPVPSPATLAQGDDLTPETSVLAATEAEPAEPVELEEEESLGSESDPIAEFTGFEVPEDREPTAGGDDTTVTTPSAPPTSAPLPSPTPTTLPPAPTTVPPAPTTTQSSGHGPVAREDSYFIQANSGTIMLDVLANDQDVDGDLNPGSLNLMVGSLTGNTAWVSNGKIAFQVRYMPQGAFRLDDALAYSVCDDTNLCTNATVRISFPTPNLFG